MESRLLLDRPLSQTIQIIKKTHYNILRYPKGIPSSGALSSSIEKVIVKLGSEVGTKRSESDYNDPTIGSYNNYNLSPNGIPSGNRRSYGFVYLVYKNAG